MANKAQVLLKVAYQRLQKMSSGNKISWSSRCLEPCRIFKI